MTRLNEVNFGVNQYCGPSVLSALTGKSTDECAAVISAVSGRSEIRAVQMTHLFEALKRLRFKVEKQKIYARSLYGNLVSLKEGMYVISVPKHVVAVEVVNEREKYLIDNHTKHPMNAGASARLMQEVDNIWLVQALPPKKFIRREYSVIERKGYTCELQLTVNWVDIYEDPSDNINGQSGTLYLRKAEDVVQVVEQLILILPPKE